MSDAARASATPVFYSRIVVYPMPGLGGDNAPIFQMLAPDTRSPAVIAQLDGGGRGHRHYDDARSAVPRPGAHKVE